MKRIWIALVAGVLAFAMRDPAARADPLVVLYSFCGQYCTAGSEPEAGVINIGDMLYGTTTGGGAYGYGTVFAVDSKTGAGSALYAFQGGSTDGSDPRAGLVDVNGILYGTTYEGGTGGCYSFTYKVGCGTVFALDPQTGTETLVYSFQNNGADGGYPEAGLIDVDGTLYGTTLGLGAYGGGTVFSLDPATGTETVLHSFAPNGSDGYWPHAGLIDVGGTLYGTTAYGGTGSEYGYGTVFALDPATDAETVLYSFCSQKKCGDGAYPEAGLTALNGTLYGTTYQGGTINCSAQGCGTVFSLDPATGTETVLHLFQNNGKDGYWPYAGVTAVDGKLYGTASAGGAFYYGTVFSLDPATGTEKTLHAFNSTLDGYDPVAALLSVRHKLYGTTLEGGAYGDGTLFSIRR